jgi:flagellar biosynthesis protein FliR
MFEIGRQSLDIAPLWAWGLLFVRMSALLHMLPGVGTDQVPIPLRFGLSFAFCFVLTTMGGMTSPLPANLAEAVMMIASEFMLGYLFGVIPSMVLSGIAVAGQITDSSIGLASANVIDPSLGQSVTILARLQSLLGSVIFLAINGHHVVIREVLFPVGQTGLSLLSTGAVAAEIMLDRFAGAFELALVVSAPIMATVLLTQFILGLLTKFVPQLNVFIVSMPLSLLVGLYVVTYSLPELSVQIQNAFDHSESLLGALMQGSVKQQ